MKMREAAIAKAIKKLVEDYTEDILNDELFFLMMLDDALDDMEKPIFHCLDGTAMNKIYLAYVAAKGNGKINLGELERYLREKSDIQEQWLEYIISVFQEAFSASESSNSDRIPTLNITDEGDDLEEKPEELYRLGINYYLGKGVPVDYEEAIKLLRKSAEQGYVEAQKVLGHCYGCGKGVEQDYKEAFHWLLLSAKQGDAIAANGVGFHYQNGLGIEQSLEKAFQWYSFSASQGNEEGQYNLGLLYYNGMGVEKDSGKCIELWETSAARGFKSAQYALGRLYYFGDENIKNNYDKAVKWLRLGAQQGDPWSEYLLGVCYWYGQGVEEDDAEARNLLEKSAASGNKEAQNLLKDYFAAE